MVGACMRTLARPALAMSLAAVTLLAQPNAVAGIDVSLGGGSHPGIENLTVLGRLGNYPNGTNALAMATTSCNYGSQDVNWFAAMNPDHPFIAFLLARESGGRIVQISDRSFLKHGFYALSNSQCLPCQNPNTTGLYLGVGCSDTYGVGNNSDNYWLAPPDEVDPWTGLWNPVGSHFDMGEPAVTGAAATDGQRSLTQAQAAALGPVGHRIRASDAELQAGGTYYFQGYYAIRREPEANRTNNLVSRRFVPSWNGTTWNVTVPTANNARVEGSILQRWTNATLSSATNGINDGRVYVGVLVTGPTNGLYHYEYAVHNRDNARGLQAFTVPICSGAQVFNAGFRDIDASAGNDWTITISSNQIRFATVPQGAAGTNPLRWNSFFNFWFDTDAAPVPNGTTSVEAWAAGPGAPSFGIPGVTVPGELYNIYLGPGCGNPAPVLSVTGNPPRAVLPNPTFVLQMTGAAPFQPVTLFYGLTNGTVMFQPGCNFYMGGAYAMDWLDLPPINANPLGLAAWFLPLPNEPALEGAVINLQALAVVPGGPIAGTYAISNGLRVRFGNNISPCP